MRVAAPLIQNLETASHHVFPISVPPWTGLNYDKSNFNPACFATSSAGAFGLGRLALGGASDDSAPDSESGGTDDSGDLRAGGKEANK